MQQIENFIARQQHAARAHHSNDVDSAELACLIPCSAIIGALVYGCLTAGSLGLTSWVGHHIIKGSALAANAGLTAHQMGLAGVVGGGVINGILGFLRGLLAGCGVVSLFPENSGNSIGKTVVSIGLGVLMNMAGGAILGFATGGSALGYTAAAAAAGGAVLGLGPMICIGTCLYLCSSDSSNRLNYVQISSDEDNRICKLDPSNLKSYTPEELAEKYPETNQDIPKNIQELVELARMNDDDKSITVQSAVTPSAPSQQKLIRSSGPGLFASNRPTVTTNNEKPQVSAEDAAEHAARMV